MRIENINKNSIFKKLLFILSIFSALLFVALLPGVHPYRFSYLLKLVPLLCLGTLVALEVKGTRRFLIFLALIFCMIGDVLLDLDRSRNFQLALVTFLTGHVFYIIIFLMNSKFDKKQLPYLVAIVLYTIIVGYFLKDISQDFLIPVMAYLAVISIMTISAFLMKDYSWYIRIGALVFMFSDTVIAINKFLTPIPYSTVFNIGLYFTAQILIITGLIRTKR